MVNLVYCFGCGKDISERCSDRYNMQGQSCAHAVPIWKRKLEQLLKNHGMFVDIECLIHEGNGHMCHSCVSALVRLEKLEKSVELNLVDALDVIIGSDVVQQPRKRRCVESFGTESSSGSRMFAPLSFMSVG